MNNWYKKADADFRYIDPEEDWEEAEQGEQILSQEKIRSRKNIQQVAIENGVVIGALSSGWEQENDDERPISVFSFDLAVKPEFRRQRIGYQLIQRSVQQYEQEKRDYQDAGYDTMMRVWVINPVLVPLLERDFGFTIEAQHEGGSVHVVRY